MADINIALELPVINGFVAIPDGQILHRTKLMPDDVLSLIPGSKLFRMGRGGAGANPPSGMTVQVYTETSKQQDQLWIQLPPYDPATGPGNDYYATLRAAAAAIP